MKKNFDWLFSPGHDGPWTGEELQHRLLSEGEANREAHRAAAAITLVAGCVLALHALKHCAGR